MPLTRRWQWCWKWTRWIWRIFRRLPVTSTDCDVGRAIVRSARRRQLPKRVREAEANPSGLRDHFADALRLSAMAPNLQRDAAELCNQAMRISAWSRRNDLDH